MHGCCNTLREIYTQLVARNIFESECCVATDQRENIPLMEEVRDSSKEQEQFPHNYGVHSLSFEVFIILCNTLSDICHILQLL